MHESGLVSVGRLIEGGFYYDNLKRMEQYCREETVPDKLVAAYILGSMFYDFAETIESDPTTTTIQDLEIKYKPIITSILNKVIAGATLEEQMESLTSFYIMLTLIFEQ